MGGRFDGGFFPGPGLELVLVALVLFVGPALAVAEPIDVRITPVPLSADDPGLENAGRLKYRGGIHLVADDPTFGGLSALGVSDDGKRMVALSDRGRRFSARLVYDETGNLAGLRNTDLATMAGLDGAPLSSRDDGDAESMSPGIEGEIIQFLRLDVLDTDGPRAQEVNAEIYEILAEDDRGAVDYFRVTVGGREILISERDYFDLPEDEHGPVRYYRHERPRLAEVEVFALGQNVVKLTQSEVERGADDGGFEFLFLKIFSDGLYS